MRVPFVLKLACAISLLALIVVASSLEYFYHTTKDILQSEMELRLRDIGQTGSYLFDAESRAGMQRLHTMLLTRSEPREEALVPREQGTYVPIFDKATLIELHNNSDFQQLVQVLRRIRSGSGARTRPFGFLSQTAQQTSDTPDVNFAYLMAPIPESPEHAIQMFIADSHYETIDANGNGAIEPEEEGNSVGTLYWVDTTDGVFQRPYRDGLSHVPNDWYTDQWGTFLTVAVPIVDEADRVLAILGLDLLVTNHANRLSDLRAISIGVVIASLLLSILCAIFLARVFSRPVAKLAAGARRLHERDFSSHIQIRNRDEFGELANTFNEVMDELGDYSENLERKIRDRTQELESANRTISRINKDLTVENLRLGAEVRVARKLQMMVLPSRRELSMVPGVDIAAFMDPADEVGGDYYDVLINEQGRAKIAIGDVCGHGLESGVVMLMVQTAVRTEFLAGTKSPADFYQLVNRVIFHNLHRIRSDKSMTLSLLDYRDDGLITVTGQHEELIVVRGNGCLERLDTVDLGIPIGLDDGIEAFIASTQIKLETGDLLLLHTDGVTEAENEAQQPFGLERLCALAQAHHRQSVGQIIRFIRAELAGYIGVRRILDDVTLVAIKKV